MREPRTAQIDGFAYRIGTLPPRRALRLGNRIVRAAGPGLVALVASPGSSLGDLDISVLGEVLRTVFAQLTPDEQDAIMEELFSAVQVEQNGRAAGVMAIFDAHFDGRLPAALQLMWVAFREN